jgi:hypothetical protein
LCITVENILTPHKYQPTPTTNNNKTKNLILNFGPSAMFIPLLPLYVILKRTIVRFTTPELTLLKVLTPLYIWIMVVGTRPHKEERFLYPVYHLIPIAAATTLWMGREVRTRL